MYIFLKSEKAISEVYGLAGGRVGRCIFQHSATHWTLHTNIALDRWIMLILNHRHHHLHCLFRAWFTFLSTSTSMHVATNSCCEALVGCVLNLLKLGSKSSGLSGGQNVVLLVGACGWL